MRRLLFLFLALGLYAGTGCAGPGPIPDVPVIDPDDPGPTPTPPPDDPPQNDPASGVITEAQFDSIVVGVGSAGTSEATLIAALGTPFHAHEAAGYKLIEYAIAGSAHVYVFWSKDGVIERKSQQ